MDLQFDNKGYLTPYNIYNITEDTLRTLKVYPPTHKYHFHTEFDKQEWAFLFCTDRKKNSKGFVQLNY